MDRKSGNTPHEYLKTKVMTASPEQLQLMLYEGAVRFCEQAREAIKNKQVETSYNLLSKAENIVLELTNSMRDEINPQTCSKMRGLYMFCYDRLVTANMKREIEPVDEALKILRHMRDTWQMVLDKLNEEKTGQSSSQQGQPVEQNHVQTDLPAHTPNTEEFAELMVGSNFSAQG